MKLKRSKKVSYRITSCVPGGKQKFEKITGEHANSIEYESKRRVHVFLYQGNAGKKPGKPVKTIRKSLANACKKAKIPYGRFKQHGFVFRDPRHIFNTYMRKA